MTDIVERLRERATNGDGWTRPVAAEAADEIERLRGEIVLLEATGAEASDEIDRLQGEVARLREAARPLRMETARLEIDPRNGAPLRRKEAVSDLADEIYEATGMILGREQAAAMTRFVQAREATARRRALEEAAAEADAEQARLESGPDMCSLCAKLAADNVGLRIRAKLTEGGR